MHPALPSFESLPIPDADIRLALEVPLPMPADALLAALIAETAWRQESIVLWGRRHLQPRQSAWYGDDGTRYRYSGIDLDPLPWTPLLAELRDLAARAAGASFNSVLVNRYRDHRDSVGLHSDDEPELGDAPTIASLSLGATRVFVMKHRHRRECAPVRVALPSASLLVMAGATQRHWKHGIDKQSRPCGERVNLTFRQIVPARTR
jgi:alkylated DNA repair dioxygenase AlkB